MSMSVGKDRRRLTVSQCDPVAGAARSSAGGGGSKDPSQHLQGLGLDQLFSNAEKEGKKAVSITSITDQQLKRVPSYSEKDTEVLFNDQFGSIEEAEEWVATFGVGAACKKGLKPESPNQDSFSILLIEGQLAVYGVFDGHGPNGHIVSNLARIILVKILLQKTLDENVPVPRAIHEAFIETQQVLEGTKESGFDPSTSGTTCTVAYHDLAEDVVTVAHVGDSRSVLLKCATNAPLEFQDLTVDHKPNLPEERQRIENSDPPGRVVFDGFYNYRVFAMAGMYPGLNMSRALGDVIAHKEAGLTAVPDVIEVSLKELREKYADIMLLVCTDGVWEFIKSDEAPHVINADGAEVRDLTVLKDKTKVHTHVNKLSEESWNRWMQDSENEISDDITAVMIYL